MSHRTCRYLATALLGTGALTRPCAAQPDTSTARARIEGRITDATHGVPVVGASVRARSLDSTSALFGDSAVVTDSAGRFVLRIRIAGRVIVQATRLGFARGERTIEVGAELPTVLAMSLRPLARALDAPVATATGVRARQTLGADVRTIDATAVRRDLPVANLSDLLASRVAGLIVNGSGESGAGSRIRLRGQSSLNLSNQPLVLLDGVRVFSETGSLGLSVGGAAPSRLDDINPYDIASIDVLMGPAAATLHGSDAANGVISLTTKRGVAGPLRYRVYAENGLVTDPHRYPSLYSGWDTRGSAPARCVLVQQAAGTCVVDSLTSGNLLNDPSTSAIARGFRRQFGFQTDGGIERVQFFLSAATESETGVYRMPDFEQERLRTERQVQRIPTEQIRPNAVGRNSVRLRVTAQPLDALTIDASVGYTGGRQRLPRNGAETRNGILFNALFGLREYLSPIGDLMSNTTTQDLHRLIRVASVEYRPIPWLIARARFGIGAVTSDDEQRQLFPIPFQTDYRTTSDQQTADISVVSSLHLAPWLASTTTLGAQDVRNSRVERSETFELLGVAGVGGGTRGSFGSSRRSRLRSAYAEQRFSFEDRGFVAAGIRRDEFELYGQSPSVTYPSVGVSWLPLQSMAAATRNVLTSLRFRGSFGASGRSPMGLPTFSGIDSRAPEISRELETGVDATLFGDRTDLSLTYYLRNTSNLLVGRAAAPTLGGSGVDARSTGKVRNSGIDLRLAQQVVDSRGAGVDVQLLASTNRNRVMSLGQVQTPIFSGSRSSQQNRPGYPLFGFWGRPYTYNDVNSDGIIASTELTISDTAQFVGPSFPTQQLVLTPTVSLLHRTLRLTALIDRQWGMRKLNHTRLRRCVNSGASCRALFDIDAPLGEQAAAVAFQSSVVSGFFEDGAFTRLREVSVAYDMPIRWANRLRASAWRLVLTGRNLGVSTSYTGVDPESQVDNSDTRGTEEFFSTPPMRTFTFRMSFDF